MPTFVRLLGRPGVQHEGEWHELPTGLSSALLYYLAYQRVWVSREKLAFLFWPDMPEANARRNLRNLVLRIKDLPCVQDLEAERNRVCWQVETDVGKFEQAIADKDDARAVELYQGELLEGFQLGDYLEFSAWLETERQTLYEMWHETVLKLVENCEVEGKHEQAAEALAQLGKNDPLDEDIIQRQLKQLHLSGQKAKALNLFESFKEKLKQDYDGEPDKTTLELIEIIHSSDVPVSTISPKLQKKGDAFPKHHLPAQATAFIGREIEIKRLSEQLADPDCRLLTIVAPGGMGKTRLALAVSEQQFEVFNGEVFFVSFVSTSTSDTMLYTLATALGFNFYDHHKPKEQLLSYLSDKRMLLILDNLEHLLSGVGLVAEMLEHASQVKILATSRERLNLHAEWLFDLIGLSVPDNETVQGLADYDAIKLLIQTARRMQTEFELNANTTPAAVRICQLTAGMPLAIELAVSWLRVMPLEAIVTEIERGIGFLETNIRDMPERHRSIRAVFDYSWQLLSEREQQALKTLTVFRGGFDRKAAAEVTDVQLFELSQLVDKSFLNVTQGGRYQRHPLVIQYAEEKAQAEPDKIIQLSEEHAWYYLRLLQAHTEDLKTLKRPETLELLEKDIQNIRLAWFRMLKTLNLEAIKTSTFALTEFFENRLVECAELLTNAVQSLDEANPDHHAALGYVLVSLVDIQLSRAVFANLPALGQKAISLLRPLGEVEGIIKGLYTIARTEWSAGRFVSSQRYAQEGLSLAKRHNVNSDVAKLYHILTFAERELSPFPEVSRLYEEAIAHAKIQGDYTGICYLQHQYGSYLIHQNDLQAGEALLQEALQLAIELDYRKLLVFISDDMALAAFMAADYERTEALSHETLSLSTHAQTTNTYGQVKALSRLARVAIARQDYTAARRHLKKSLQLAWETDSIFGVLAGLGYFGEWHLAQGQYDEAAYYLCYVHSYPALSNELKVDIDAFLKRLPTQCAQVARDLHAAEEPDLEEVVTRLLTGLEN